MSQALTNNDDMMNSISRKPADYRPEGNHFFQKYYDRGGKVEDSGLESWIITYLIKYGRVHDASDEGRYVFKGRIEAEHGETYRWWLPVQKTATGKHLITTAPYVKGLKDIDIKLLNPIKPDELR